LIDAPVVKGLLVFVYFALALCFLTLRSFNAARLFALCAPAGTLFDARGAIEWLTNIGLNALDDGVGKPIPLIAAIAINVCIGFPLDFISISLLKNQNTLNKML
jgi:hypothetical protein